MKSYPVKENYIGSAVSKILWYRQTDILLLYLKDFLMKDIVTILSYNFNFRIFVLNRWIWAALTYFPF